MGFGERLTALMAERGISERALAKQVKCDRSYIHLLKTGKRTPGERIAQRLDEALGAEGELMALVPRRSVLAGGLLAGGLLAISPEAERLRWAARHPSRVDAEMVDSLAGVLAAQLRAADRVGAKAVMPAVLAQLASIKELVGQARGPVRPALVNVAQQWAQFAAYLHRDAGDAAGDRAWLSQAREWADEVGDRTMAATVFVQLGYIALYAGQVGTAIGLGQAAQRDSTVAVGQRIEAANLEARGYALAGDAAAAERAAGNAEDMAGHLPGVTPDRCAWLYWCTPGMVVCKRGALFGMLAADPRYRDRAVQLLGDGYEQLPADQRSSAWAARNLAHLAAVHVRSGDVDEAVPLAVRCAEMARVTASARLSAMVASVHDHMRARWPSHPGVAELREALR